MISLRQLFSCCFSLILLSLAGQLYANENWAFNPTQQALFTMKGSNTIGASLGPNLAKLYLEHNGVQEVRILPSNVENEYKISGQLQGREVYIDIAAHGSSTGFRALHNDSADIAMSSRPIKGKEVKKLRALGDMLNLKAEHVIAIDGIAVIVHPSNPISQLSVQQIARVFSGEIHNWNQLSSNYSGAINIYARDNNSGTWDTFKNLVLAKKIPLSESAKRFESNDLLSDTVTADPQGIGFVGLASVRQAKALSVSDENTVALQPLHMTIATEDYPLARRLHLYTAPSSRNWAVSDFLSFVHGRMGQEVVEEVGFISQNPVAVDNLEDRQGPNEYLKLTHSAKRLSLNFRFKPSSASLDNKARQDIIRLSQFLQLAENRHMRLLLIGFGDEKQSERRAHILSKLRASAVKSALRHQGISTLPVAGFGAFKPVATNSSSKRIKNRRVEVWLVPENSHTESLSMAWR
ncbi:substrate-binding domain-containing protein [uncultured Pseudoteredinibacter sp.]|uniref:substrate-binding domain-containing protein n=1 Tax=uncultured Pseudoteredinibacter sp. TaxID=1641701 RepID=UPI00262AD81D|nr:substrate-binding domain-containing protein [uncultured Pseudoteredinibacter sp.]